jgi:hypothetical protein
MNKQVIFNLPVKDLEKSKAFFSALGFGFHPQVSRENAAMVVIVEDAVHAMLATEAFFQSLIDKFYWGIRSSTIPCTFRKGSVFCAIAGSPGQRARGVPARMGWQRTGRHPGATARHGGSATRASPAGDQLRRQRRHKRIT